MLEKLETAGVAVEDAVEVELSLEAGSDSTAAIRSCTNSLNACRMFRIESVESVDEVVPVVEEAPRLEARSWRNVVRFGLLPTVLPVLPEVPFVLLVPSDVLVVLPDVLLALLEELPPEAA